MSSVGGPNEFRHTPNEIRQYEREYKDGANLFQEAIQHYAQSDNPYQKEEFKQVMKKALDILNQTARELNRKELFDQNARIEKDYAQFNKSPDNGQIVAQLEKDLDDAQNKFS